MRTRRLLKMRTGNNYKELVAFPPPPKILAWCHYSVMYNIIFFRAQLFCFFINRFDEKQMHLATNKSIWDGTAGQCSCSPPTPTKNPVWIPGNVIILCYIPSICSVLEVEEQDDKAKSNLNNSNYCCQIIVHHF